MERHLHRVRTGPDRYPDLPRVVGGALPLDILLVLGAAPVHSFGLQLAVQAHLELVQCVERLQRATGVAAQPHTNAYSASPGKV